MITWREAVVTELRRTWRGASELSVELADGSAMKALAYPELTGTPAVGDRVVLNISALARGLGTGGYAFVVALPDRLPHDPEPGPGHIVKARYTPLQAMVMAADEQESPWHDELAGADDLEQMPVVLADLHSALPAVLAGIRAEDESLRVAYVMTDGAALPLWLSRAVAGLREADWLHASVTAGQAFGGDYEAVTVHSALLVAKYVAGADITIVTQGPGNVGTGTSWGFSGVAVGEHVNAASALGGVPVAALRVSGADARGRHVGISHHTLTALGKVALTPAQVPVPGLDGDLADLGEQVRQQAQELGEAGHELHHVPTEGLLQALATSPVGLSTMGRNLDADPASFLAAAAAGRFAASLVRGD